VPDAPVIGTASSPGVGQATVTFAAPANNGGTPITRYTVTASPGGVQAFGTGSPINVGGLASGTVYTFSVSATNRVGTSISSAGSNSMAVGVSPGAPTIGVATAGTGVEFEVANSLSA